MPYTLLARTLLGAVLTVAFAVVPLGAAAQNAAAESYEQALIRFQADDLEGTLLGLKDALKANPELLSAHILLARVFMRLSKGAAAEYSLIEAQRLGGDPNVVWPLRARALMLQLKFAEVLALAPNTGLAVDAQAEVLVYRGHAQIELGKTTEAEQTFLQARDLAPQSPTPLIGLATVAFRRQDLKTAEARALAAVRVAPDDAQAWAMRGSIAHAVGQGETALEAYARALEIAPTHHDARVSRAGVLIDMRRYDDAASDIEYLLENYPLDPRSAYLSSVHLSKTGRREEATTALRRAAYLLDEIGLQAVERDPRLQMLAGIANFELRQYEQSKTFLNQYLDRYPHDIGARKMLGSIHLAQKQPEVAIQVLESVLRRVPNDPRVLSLLALAYIEKGRYDIATRYLEKAVKLTGGASNLRTRLALSRLGSGDVARGMSELSELFDENPQAHTEAGTALAIAYLKRGDARAALRVSERLVEVAPRDLTALNLLASSQLALGRLDDARLTYESALAQDPTYIPARINVAELMARAGRENEARALFEAVLEEHPAHVHTMVQLAKLEASTGRVPEALRWLNKARDTDPQSVPAALALVDLHLRLDDPAQALRVAEEVEDSAPENLEVLAAVGRSHVALGREDLAREMYTRMARVAGFDPGTLYGVAELQLAVGATKDAAYTLTKALKGDPGHVRVQILLAETQLRLGQLGEARERAETLLVKYPNLVAAHGLLGDVQMAMAEPKAARASYQSALAIEPSSRLVVKRFEATVAAGETAAAMRELTKWVEARPSDRLALRALAEGHLAAGDYEVARGLYERLLEFDPDDAKALNNLAHILDRLGDDRALEVAARARTLAPEDPAVSDTFGWLLVRAGEVERGLGHLRGAYARASGHPEIQYHLGAALAALGRSEEARRWLEQALAASADFNGAADARALLERLGE